MNVFVYGTLKTGYGNNRLMVADNAILLDKDCFTAPGYRLFSFGSFPGMALGESMVHGELWRVNDISSFDRLEGHPHFYERQEIELLAPPENDEPVYAYIHPFIEKLDDVHFTYSGKYEIQSWNPKARLNR